jgi:ubiquitin-conjugating enzyme E2 J2
MTQPSKLCKRRLAKEWKMLNKEPVTCVRAAPNENNILEWHFLIHSLDDDRYRGGYYHGIILFPPDYPYKPPSLKLLTPQGRFQTNTKLCLSITDFHPESWNPLWSVSSILAAVVSFFVEDLSTYGSIRTSKRTKVNLAQKSLEYNVKSSVQFRTLFPDLVELHQKMVELKEQNKLGSNDKSDEQIREEKNISEAEALHQGRKSRLFEKQLLAFTFIFGVVTAILFFLFKK